MFLQLGSILSNCLLVLGCAFLLGGIKYTVQRFNRPAAVTNSAMLMLSVMTLMCKLLIWPAQASPVFETLDSSAKPLTEPVRRSQSQMSWKTPTTSPSAGCSACLVWSR